LAACVEGRPADCVGKRLFSEYDGREQKGNPVGKRTRQHQVSDKKVGCPPAHLLRQDAVAQWKTQARAIRPSRPEHPDESAIGLGDQLVARLDKIDADLSEIRKKLDAIVDAKSMKDWYTTVEVARLTGKAEYTVREWCRQGRIQARKKPCGRGKAGEWLISHDELTRFMNEGLLPFRPVP
jgi:hypothetical protein